MGKRGYEKQIWLTTDTHLNHRMLSDKGHRPDNFEHLILKEGGRVPQDAVLVHLGDVCIGQDEAMHAAFHDAYMASVKVLVRGNHDKKSDSWYYTHGWDLVVKKFVVDKYGERILFSHEPHAKPHSWEGVTLNVHGHTHGNEHRRDDYPPAGEDRRFHVGLALENTNYKPVSLQGLLRK